MKLRNLTFQILEEFFVSPSIIYLVKKFMLSKHVHAFSHPEFQVTRLTIRRMTQVKGLILMVILIHSDNQS